MHSFFAIKSYCQYLFNAQHRKGFGIHSPFVFRLLNTVFYENTPYYCYEKWERERDILERDATIIKTNDFGTGDYTNRKTGDITRHSAKRTKYAQLLFRLANSNRSQTILELGTCVGLTTLYFSAVNPQGKVITIDGDEALCRIARGNFTKFHADTIESYCGTIDTLLPDILAKTERLDFVFFDANHTKEATLKYFGLCLPKAASNTIFVFDDIYRDKGMYAAWQKIKSDKNIRLAIDIYEMGIVFFNNELIKQEYTVAF
jgi:predicted O-methyltransferase YrrM